MNRLPDQDVRELILRDLDANFLVEAGAGSGKTTSLAGRMVRLIATGTCPVERIAAVTFTRKAAAELRQRFQEGLEKALRPESDPVTRGRLGEALENLDAAFIGTIHSFCARLLRERPVEAGLGPEFEEIEGIEETLLKQQAWNEYLLRVRLERPAILERLDSLDISPADLEDGYDRVVLYPDVTMAGGPVSAPDLGGAREGLEQFLELAARYMPGTEPEKGWDDLQSLVRRASRWRAAFNLGDDRYFLRLLARMDKNARPVLKRWNSPEGAREVERAFNTFRAGVVAPVLKRWREYRHSVVLDFLLEAARHYGDVRRRLNRVNFQDLLMNTAEMLRDNPGVRAYFQQRYTHLLVDEFQDTDPVQAEIMLYMTGGDTHEKDWTALAPRNGSLFVVGDPKQSIYRFRRADIDTYNLVKRRIAETGGHVVHLTSNFRSAAPIVNWVNSAFQDLFSVNGAPYQACYTAMTPVREDAGNGDSGIRRLELAGAPRQEDVVREDAARVASWIRRGLEGNLRLSRTPDEARKGLCARPVPGDFMILVMWKRNMDLYGKALAELGIPYTISGESSIKRSAALREFHYLLECLADPGNPVYLVAALRGLFFGISDRQLYEFRQAGGRFCFLSQLPGSWLTEPAPAAGSGSGARGDARSAFREAWDRLQRYWRWTRDLPPSAAIEMIADDLGLFAYTQASGDIPGSLVQFIEEARRQERRCMGGFAGVVGFLERLLEQGAEEDIDIEGGKRPGVRIMNLHKAKGLEAPVVILCNPSSNPQHEPDFHVRRDPGVAAGYLSISKKGEYRGETLAAPPGWEAYQEEEGKYLAAERIRLLYVAATRAKNLLVVSQCQSRATKNPWAPLEPFLQGVEPVGVAAAGAPGGDCELGMRTGDNGSGDAQGAEVPAHTTFGRACEEIRAAVRRIAVPTYRHESVTGAAGRGAHPASETGGRGPRWGNAIHRILAVAASRGLGAGRLLADPVACEGLEPGDKDEIIRALVTVTSSDFWRRVIGARERVVEAPFGVFEEGVYLTGAIDLAFKEETGWVIVDFKSDVVDSPGHLQKLVDYYAPQVREYACRWSAITGEPVAECGLFFTGACEWRPV